MKIKEFKQGDYLVRTEPPKNCRDMSYVGDGYRLIGIANGRIYCKVIHDGLAPDRVGNVLEIELHLYDDDKRERFIDPAILESGLANRVKIEQMILKAALSDDYEQIKVLSNVLKEL
ncbi:MAG TPA: hypothetical protein VFC36_03115 [Paludibacter sp.]|nr:hypothetical protein [Paludibacter sp.]